MNRRIPRDELMELRREAARRRAKPALVVAEEPEPGLEPVWVVEPEIHPIDLDDGRVDEDAAKVVRRLIRGGHQAYLVGGCVRDLMLGRSPKDFDVATSASPDEVRSLFRNSRIIGRRFRLVHVVFGGGKVIETATFRRAPTADETTPECDLLIRDDNAFGVAHEDAARRDFTINGLFYDLENKRVLDWVGGVSDVERRVVRTIGDPVVRFHEDPVRMLRAIKFTARLDLGMSPRVYDAIVHCRGSLALAARPRLFEELMRLLREGSAHRTMWLAWETGVLDVLLPELASYLSDDPEHAGLVWRTLSALDRRSLERGPLDDAVLAAVLLLEPMREACAAAQDRFNAGFEFLEPIMERLAMPRRIADAARRVVAMMPRLESGKGGRLAKTNIYGLAMEVLELSREGRQGTFPPPPARRASKPPPPLKAPSAKASATRRPPPIAELDEDSAAPEVRAPSPKSSSSGRSSGSSSSSSKSSGKSSGRSSEGRAAEGRTSEGRAAEGRTSESRASSSKSSSSKSSGSKGTGTKATGTKGRTTAKTSGTKKRARTRKPEAALGA